MFEWILVVWLVVSGPEGVALAPAFEVGTYRMLDGDGGCDAAAASLKTEDPDQSFIAKCISRDKQ